ncbi:MAG: cobC [Micavibrio sp.]|nr:cobC [Micavibrio sp.]
MRFYYIRHGETDWNKAGMMQGSKDIPLNATGLAQAMNAAGLLKSLPITRIVSSPQNRAYKTADIIAQVFSLAVHLEPDLRERHFGDYEGLPWQDVSRVVVANGNDVHGPFDYPSGKAEPFSDLATRSKTAIEKWMAAHSNDVILFVAHGGVFGALTHALNAKGHPRIANATPYEFVRDGNGNWACQPV